MFERVFSLSLALTLCALLLAVTMQELLGPTPNAVFGLIAARSGLAIFEPGVRYLTAGLQLLAVVLILAPRTRSLGAALALVVAAGAIAMHLSPWLGVALPQAQQASAALAAGATAAQIGAMNLPSDKGGMFLLALAIAVLGGATIFVERARIRALRPRARRPAGAFA